MQEKDQSPKNEEQKTSSPDLNSEEKDRPDTSTKKESQEKISELPQFMQMILMAEQEL